MQRLLSTIADDAMGELLRGNHAFVRLSRDLLLEQTDVLAEHRRLGIIVDPASIADAALISRLQQLSDRGCALMLDLCELDANAETRMAIWSPCWPCPPACACRRHRCSDPGATQCRAACAVPQRDRGVCGRLRNLQPLQASASPRLPRPLPASACVGGPARPTPKPDKPAAPDEFRTGSASENHVVGAASLQKLPLNMR